MDQIRRIEIAVAILFIMATVLFSVGQAAHLSILNDPDYLTLATASSGRIVAGTLTEFMGVLAIPLTAVFLFPLLKRHSESLARSYVTIRTIEAIPLLLVEGLILAILALGQSPGGGDPSVDWQTVGATIQALREAVFLMSVGLVFPIGCVLLNSMLLKTRLVPGWLAVWGIGAGVVLLSGSALSLFGLLEDVPPAALEAAIAGPVAIQEMVFAGWLLAKGFDPGALKRLRT
ncbi:MAG: DUF4386 domain-containing protein [Gemmatimonadetes bacterium]|nr:DUF4386 domain-containing protein [Gemmatimonadota bacterium]